MKLLFSIYAVLFIICVQAQTINLEHYDKAIYSSNFNSNEDAKIWPSVNSKKDLIIFQNSNYLIHRKDSRKGKFIFPKMHNTYKNYELQVTFKTETESISGICFGFNLENSSGYILEFKPNKEFRLRHIKSDGTQTFITGEKEKNSWISSDFIEKTNSFNEINIVVNNDLREIYFNSFFVYSFNATPRYKERNFGFIIDPSTKVIVKQIDFFVNNNEKDGFIISENSVISSDSTNTSSPNYLKKIVVLKSQIDEMKQLIEEHSYMLEKCKEDNIGLNTYISNNIKTELVVQLKDMKELNVRLEKQLEKIKTENKALQEYKDVTLKSSKDTDIINFLYDEIHRLEEENADLKSKILE